jgi:menaquinone-dependent protoporphyrinogen oxidase
MKALIVYGTRYGAAASTAQEIAKVLTQQGLEVKVVDAKREKINDIAGYNLVVVGSGIQINRWTSEPEDFLKGHQKELATKKLALFVCCGSATTGKPEDLAEAKRKYLEEKALKYNLLPIALGLFGGVYNYNKQPWWAKRALEADRPRVEATYKAIELGIYDTRDWNAIRNWAKDIARKSTD